MIGLISGSGFYDLELEHAQDCEIQNEFGSVKLRKGELNGVAVVFYSRHGEYHQRLPSMLNYRAYMKAMKDMGVELLIATSVCGVLKQEIPLGKLLLFEDTFFPDNRLPSGELCTIHTREADPDRGHLIAASLINQQANKHLESLDAVRELTYAHVNGPRLNSKAEIRFFSQCADVISQTCGPEAVLAGELEIPYALLGFGVDYANGVSEIPTSIDELNQNMVLSKDVFNEAIQHLLTCDLPSFEGFNYRFNHHE
jgi:5'-methylthioadenosine phosphorylase